MNEEFEELTETLINGNISDYKKSIQLMTDIELEQFMAILINNEYCYSPEFIIDCLVNIIRALEMEVKYGQT